MSTAQFVLTLIAFIAYATLAIGTMWLWCSLVIRYWRGEDRTVPAVDLASAKSSGAKTVHPDGSRRASTPSTVSAQLASGRGVEPQACAS